MKAKEAITNLQKVRPYQKVLVDIDGKVREITGFKIASWDRKVPGEEQMQQAIIFTVAE